MRDRWVLRILATLAALLFTAAGIKLYLTGLPLVSEKVTYLLNPGAILVNWIWPEGPHTGTFLAAFSFLFLIAADLVLWWAIAYYLVLIPGYRILARVRS